MQMRQHLNICPKQLTRNKCLAAQKRRRRSDRRRAPACVATLERLTGWFFHSFQGSQDPGLAFEDRQAGCNVSVFTESHEPLSKRRFTLADYAEKWLALCLSPDHQKSPFPVEAPKAAATHL